MIPGLLPFAVRRGCVHALLLCAGIFTISVDADDWPQLLGPSADGVSRETGLLDRFPTNGPPVLWSKAVGTGYSAPSIRGSRLILHHRLNNEEIVECMDAATGESRWRYAYGSEFVDPYGYNNGPRSTPVVGTNAVYTFGAEGKLLCLEVAAGKLIWQRDTAKEWEIPSAFFGVGSTPILDDSRLFVMVGGQPNSGVVALDAATGRTIWESVGETSWQGARMIGWPSEPIVRWQRWEKQASYSTPRLVTIRGQRHLLCLTRQGLVSLDPADGKVRFKFWFRARVNESVNAMTPVVVEDLILISAAYYKVGSVLLRVRPDGQGVDEVWRGTSLEMHWANPLLDRGRLFGFSGRNEPDARFRCVELLTGRLLWERDERWAAHSTPTPDVFGRGSGILADGKMIMLGEGGLLGLFKPDSKEPQEVSRWQVPGLHYPAWTAPVLAERKLYLRSEDRLVCLDFARK